jgi:SAM-dependent methyltransferase
VSGRATSFGAVATAYERFRLGYPAELVDLVMAYADGPVRTALEIGAGTGKATRVFADRGILVTATEPDAAMLEVLRQHVPASVVTVTAALEDLGPTTTYDLVYVAAALHWTDVEGRWPRIAALLGPGGTFASFGGATQLADPAVEAAVHDARRPFLDTDDVPSPDGTPPEDPMQWPGTELEQSPLFTDVQQHVMERRTTLEARDYVGHLSTVSAYLQLPADQRRQAFERILGVLPDPVEVTADITLHLARRIA